MSEEKTTQEETTEEVSKVEEEKMVPGEGKGEEVAEEAVERPQTPAEKEAAEKNEKIISDSQALAKEIFDEKIATSELPFASIELIGQFVNSYISILKGSSKQWERVVQAQSDFFETKITDLDVKEYEAPKE